jgi:peptidyl-prolyl cis-trans isomerase C
MKSIHYAAVLMIAATTLAFSGQVMAADSVLATVNGKKITQTDYDKYLQTNTQSAQLPKERIVDELVNRELIYQAAIKEGLDKDKDIKAKIEALRVNVILGAVLDKVQNGKPITDEELKQLYDEMLKTFKMNEYKARHILLNNKQDAEKVITELDMGGDFKELAKKRSTAPSAEQGGDIGWFAASQLVAEFSDALLKLKKGEYTKQPVQTKFGWHVIKFEDSRAAKPPEFDEVKDRLTQKVMLQRVADYVFVLRAFAKIKIN